MFRFESPWFLLALLLLPIALYVGIKRKGAVVPYSSADICAGLPVTWKVRFANLPLYITTLSIAFLVLALARPQWGDDKHEVTTEGIDIVLCIDVSTSMYGLDMDDEREKNRLDIVKEVVSDFISHRHHDRIGVVVFAGEAYTQCPMVFDTSMLLNFIRTIKIGMTPTDGTAIGLGLMNSLARLKKSKAKSKIVLLLTDGENNKTEVLPQTAAEAAKELGVKVYTIGVGKKGDVPYKKDFFGRTVIDYFPSNPDFTALKKIAETTGGVFFRAGDQKTVERVYKKIDALEKTKIESATYFNWRELFPFCIAIASVLLLGAALISATILRRLP